jgi:hypothetical protein
MERRKQATSSDILDVYFGKHVLWPYQYISAVMFPQSESLSESQLQEGNNSQSLVEKVCLIKLPDANISVKCVSQFLQELICLQLFIPNYQSRFDITNPQTHRGKWKNAPNLHQTTPPHFPNLNMSSMS